MPARAHDVPAPRLLYLVKQLESAIRARMDVALRSRRITVPQYTALTVLEQHDDMSAAQLARHTFVTAQAMDGVVGALQKAGLIERHRDPENRRRLVISLTQAGRALLEDCRADIDRIEAVAFASLTIEQRTRLSEWLGESRRALAAESRNVPRYDQVP
jgi:DNA-binding MarR family transcriptional regulator